MGIKLKPHLRGRDVGIWEQETGLGMQLIPTTEQSGSQVAPDRAPSTLPCFAILPTSDASRVPGKRLEVSFESHIVKGTLANRKPGRGGGKKPEPSLCEAREVANLNPVYVKWKPMCVGEEFHGKKRDMQIVVITLPSKALQF